MSLQYVCSNCGGEMNISDNDIYNLAQTKGMFQKRLQCSLCGALIAIPDARLENQAEISGYRIKNRIEVDGAREIYAAEHLETHKRMELQVFQSHLLERGEPSKLFLEAMSRFMKIRHPNLISIKDAGQSSGGVYFAAWQRVKSTSLENRLGDGGALELKPALHLATLIARVLEWLWAQQGLIYGSLSPRRIWIAPDNSVLLFNTILTPLVKNQPPTFPIASLGMPGFMSPELLNGATQLDCRSDIYAFGATLYNMLTGSAPFCGLNSQQIQESQMASSLPDPRTLVPNLPAAVVELLKSTLAHDPNDRPKDWPTLIAQLTNLQKDKPIIPPAPMAHHSVLIQMEPFMVPPPSKKTVILRTSQIPVKTMPPPTPMPNPSRAFYGILGSGLIVLIAFILWVTLSPAPPPIPNTSAQHATTNTAAPTATTALSPKPEQKLTNAVSLSGQTTNSFESLYKATLDHLKTNPTDYDGLLAQYDALLAITETSKPNWHTRIMEERRGIEMIKSFALDRAMDEVRQKASEFSKNGNFGDGVTWLTSYHGTFSNQTRELRERLSSNLVLQAQAKAESNRIAQQKNQAAQFEELAILRKAFLATLSKAVLDNHLDQAREMIQNWNQPRDLGWSQAQQEEVLAQVDLLSKLPTRIMECYQALIGKTVTLELSNGPINGKLMGIDNQNIKIQAFASDGGVITMPVTLDKILPQDVFRRLASSPIQERTLLQGFYAWQHNEKKTAMTYFAGMTNSLLAAALAANIDLVLNQSHNEEAERALNSLIALSGVVVGKDDSQPIAAQIDQTSFPEAQCLKIKEAAQRFTELYGQTETAQKAASILAALNTVSPVVRKIDLATLETMMNSLKNWKSGDNRLLFSYRIDGALACLDLSENKILPDLTPLKIIPFKEISLRKCGMTKLPQLEGFRIDRLDLSDSAIVNLSGIKGATIGHLIISGTAVTNLHALKSVPIRFFQAVNCTSLSDLSGLATNNLVHINLSGTAVSDLAPLEGAPLVSADFSKCTLLNNLSFLAQSPITELSFAGCSRISMIYALKGLPLRKLDISGTTVSDLSPLGNAPLESLNLANARNVTDFSPLVGNKSLRNLTLPNDTVNVTCLRQLKTLETIGFPTPIEATSFWKKNP